MIKCSFSPFCVAIHVYSFPLKYGFCDVAFLLLFLLQLPHRRVTFSAANQAQDLQDPSQHSYYDSGLEESETPSSKSSSGPRIGPLALPEDHYERTTPDGSIGEMEHPENGKGAP